MVGVLPGMAHLDNWGAAGRKPSLDHMFMPLCSRTPELQAFGRLLIIVDISIFLEQH